MTNPAAVSVLMAVRNGLPYVKEAVDSIIRQTVKDWEFVIVDNASHDGTRKYLEDVSLSDPRIRLIYNDTSTDMGTGLNIGLRQCRSAWVARMDADDIALPNRLERQLAFIRENPDISVAPTLIYYINEKGAVIGRNTSEWTDRAAVDETIKNKGLIGFSHPSVIMRKDVVEETGGYRPQFWPADDIDLWKRVLERRHRILVQPEYLLKYRIHKSGSSFVFKGAWIYQLKTDWIKDCASCRLQGKREPNWEEFMTSRKRMPLFKKIDAGRKDLAKILYKYAALNFSYRAYHKVIPAVTAAFILRPKLVIVQAVSKRW